MGLRRRVGAFPDVRGAASYHIGPGMEARRIRRGWSRRQPADVRAVQHSWTARLATNQGHWGGFDRRWWREREGVEPTTPTEGPGPTDLKSAKPTGTHPLPRSSVDETPGGPAELPVTLHDKRAVDGAATRTASGQLLRFGERGGPGTPAAPAFGDPGATPELGPGFGSNGSLLSSTSPPLDSGSEAGMTTKPYSGARHGLSSCPRKETFA